MYELFDYCDIVYHIPSKTNHIDHINSMMHIHVPLLTIYTMPLIWNHWMTEEDLEEFQSFEGYITLCWGCNMLF